jgi:hypothetical protein
MAAPFGFSAGDFIAAISFINDIRKAVRETGGAKECFADILEDLTQVELVLAYLAEDSWAQNCDPSHANAVRGMARSCQVLLKSFLEKLNFYKPMPDEESAHGPMSFIKGKFRPVRWMLQM